jgi:transmembrane sensor
MNFWNISAVPKKKTGLNDLILAALESGQVDEQSLAVANKITASVDVTLMKEIAHRRNAFRGTRRLWSRISVAAVTVLSLGLGLYFYVNRSKPTNDTVTIVNDIEPGKMGATLTLANGKKILLGTAQNGELAKEAGVTISKSANGQLIYELKDAGGSGKETFNTLSTANGETYTVILPDKSKVWMNAASSLKYSLALASASKREVELSGEAYFEVAKDAARPFIVTSGSLVTKVLGTHFNIRNYPDDPSAKVTLLEGSVKVEKGPESLIIKPGQQVESVIGHGLFAATTADIEQVMAWREGKFRFGENSAIETVMSEIARWYDIDVEYRGTINRHFGGSISRQVAISKVLTLLQSTGGVKFKVEGRRVIVMP